jgi:general stress protein 26
LSEKVTIDHVADAMKGIDVAILSTHAENGSIASRPMSNNGDVRYDGTSYFFTHEGAACVSDIRRNANVALGYSSKGGVFSGAVYVTAEGTAEQVQDKAAFDRHWTSDFDKWFDKGINTPGLVLLKVRAHRLKIWERNQEQELIL